MQFRIGRSARASITRLRHVWSAMTDRRWGLQYTGPEVIEILKDSGCDRVGILIRTNLSISISSENSGTGVQ